MRISCWFKGGVTRAKMPIKEPIRVSEFPQLKFLCWQLRPDIEIDGQEAFAIYRRNWKWVDESLITNEENALIDYLIGKYGKSAISLPET